MESERFIGRLCYGDGYGGITDDKEAERVARIALETGVPYEFHDNPPNDSHIVY